MQIEARAGGQKTYHLKRDLVIIYLISLLIRLAGVDWGGINMDEFINKSVHFLSGELKPTNFFYPQLSALISAFGCGIMFIVGRFFGFIESIEDLKEIYYANDEVFLIAARSTHCIITALIGPISYVFTSYLGFARRVAIVVALTTTLTPASVWFAHFAKPQNGMTMGALAAAVFAICYMNSSKAQQKRTFIVGLGISAGVAIAFMQSAVLLLGPLALTTIIYRLREIQAPQKEVLTDFGLTLGITIVTWCLLSILDLLYLSDFLEYQILQSQLSLRSNGSLSTLYNQAFFAAISPTTGIGPAAFILVPIATYFSRIRAIKWVSTALMLSAILLAWRVGDRVMPRLFLHYIVVLITLSAVSFASICDQRQPSANIGGWLGMSALFLANCWGSGLVLQQVWSVPASTLVGQELQKLVTPKGPLVMASHIRDAGLKPSAAAEDLTFARHQRLAEKYGVNLPARSEARTEFIRTQGGYPIIGIPWVIGGLETTPPEDVKIVKPYAWPVQPEEWDLDYWLNKGVMIYVTRDIEYYTSEKTTNFYRGFHQDLVKRCKIASYIDAKRPLFLQTEYHIFDCRKAP